MEAVLWKALTGAAWIVNTAAAIFAPSREVDVFVHRLQARGRSWSHHAAYGRGPGTLCLEFGGWTVDVGWTPSHGGTAPQA